MATQNKPQTKAAKPSVVDDDFIDGMEAANVDESEFEQGDIGDFETVSLSKEGDSWKGIIVGDCALNRPDWLPEAFEDNCYETRNPDNKKGIISKFWKLEKYIEIYGYGAGIIFLITRGKKTEKGKNRSYVDFIIRHKITNAKLVKKVGE